MTQESTYIGDLLFNALKNPDTLPLKGDLVTFETKDNRKLTNAHGSVLKARSPYFRRILKDVKSTYPIKVAISDEVFNLLLEYLYLSSPVQIQPHNILELYSAAKQFDLIDLSAKIKKCFEENYQEFLKSSRFLENSTVEDILGLPEIFEGIEVETKEQMNLSSKLMSWIPKDDTDGTCCRLAMSVLEKITKFNSGRTNIYYLSIKMSEGQLIIEKCLFQSDSILESWKFEEGPDPVIGHLIVQMSEKQDGVSYSFNCIIIPDYPKKKSEDDISDGIFEFEMQVYTCVDGKIYRLEVDDEQQFSLRKVATISGENVKMLGILDKTDKQLTVLISKRDGHSFQKLNIFANGDEKCTDESHALAPEYSILTVRGDRIYLWAKYSIIVLEKYEKIDVLYSKLLETLPFKCVVTINEAVTLLTLMDEKCEKVTHVNLNTMQVVHEFDAQTMYRTKKANRTLNESYNLLEKTII